MAKNIDEDKKIMAQVAREIVKVPIDEFLHENYLPYAYYVIRNRALVSTDGLKPVNRRILYDMYRLKIYPSHDTVKAQMIAGDVMGKYHPHGESGIDGGLAHMAQKFATRVPLIEPHGSVGYSTGDRASAPRYWEAKLTKPAMELLVDLDNNALPMSTNYDGTRPEPAILPIRWPVTIINGTEGIAVGYASTIFANNPSEVMSAAIALVKNPDLTIDELMKIMPGPDFPTGGEIIEADGIKKMYETGKGSFKLRGKYTTKNLSRGRTEILFNELPFQVSAEQVSIKIKSLKKDGKLQGISSYKDLSGKDIPVKYQIILKAGTNPKILIKDLFNLTPLCKQFTSNNTVLDDGIPVKKGIISLFEQFLDLRRTCLRNSTTVQVAKDKDLIVQLTGLTSVLVDLDKAISIIRKAESDKEAQLGLQKEFKINEVQADYVLSMQLRKLTRTNQVEIDEKLDKLNKELPQLEKILTDKDTFNQAIINQLEATKKIIADKRRTTIIDKSAEALKAEERKTQEKLKELEKSSKVKLVQYADGKIYKGTELPKSSKSVPIHSEITIKGKQDLFALLADGTGVKVPSSYIPFNKIVNPDMLGLKSDSDVVSFGKMDSDSKDCGLLCVTSKGRIATLDGRIPANSDSFSVIKLADDEHIVFSKWIKNSETKLNLVMVSSDGYVARIPVTSMRVTGFGSQGIRGMVINENAKLVAASLMNNNDTLVSMTSLSIKNTELKDIPERKRGAKGVILQRLSKRSGQEIVSAFGGANVYMTDKLGNEMEIPEPSPRATSGLNFPTLGLILGEQNKENPDINDN